MFEKATRLKLLFETPVGLLSVQDLWDLPLTSSKKANLNDIAKGLHKQLQSGDDISFVEGGKKSDETVQLKFDIVKHIIDVRLAENIEASTARERAERRQKILAAIARREDEDLNSMSLEDLRKAVAET